MLLEEAVNSAGIILGSDHKFIMNSYVTNNGSLVLPLPLRPAHEQKCRPAGPF